MEKHNFNMIHYTYQLPKHTQGSNAEALLFRSRTKHICPFLQQEQARMGESEFSIIFQQQNTGRKRKRQATT